MRFPLAGLIAAILLLNHAATALASITATPGGVDSRFQMDPTAVQGGYSAFLPLSDGRAYVALQPNPIPRVVLLRFDGSIDPSFQLEDETVYAQAIFRQPSGKLILMGVNVAASYNGVTLNGMARYNPDGTLDTSFGFPYAPASANVALNSRFQVMDDLGRIHLSASNARWVRLGVDGQVEVNDTQTGITAVAPETSGGAILVNGLASGAGLVRRLADGSVDSTFSAAVNGGTVGGVKRLSDGRYVIYGRFLQQVGGVARTGLAVLQKSGALDTSFVPFKGSSVIIITLQAAEPLADGKLLLGGQFLVGSAFTERAVIRLNADGSIDPTFETALPASTIVTSVVAAGPFAFLSGGRRIFLSNDAGGAVVLRPPEITLQPTGLTLPLGASGTLATAATGSDPLTFQWYRNGVPSPLLVGPKVSVAALPSTVGDYYCVVSNEAGKATSAVVKVTVNVPPPKVTLVSTFPLDLGSTTSFGPFVTDAQSPLTYQWFKNGTAVAGATAASFSFPSVTAADAGTYSVVVKDDFGNSVTSGPCVVTVNLPNPPRVMLEPADVITTSGGAITLRADFDSQPPTVQPKIQWRRNGVPIAGGEPTSRQGLWMSILNILNASASDEGVYDCVVTSAGGSAVTKAAQVTVKTATSADALDLSFNAGTANRVGFSNPNGDGQIQAIAVQSDDKVLVAGEFQQWNGVQRTNLVRLNVDGSLDTSFASHHFAAVQNGLTAVSGVAVAPDGRIYISGTWSKLDGVDDGAVGHLVRLLPDGKVDTAFRMPASSGAGDAIAILQDGTVFNNGFRLQGNFTMYMHRFPVGGAADPSYDAGYSGARIAGTNPGAIALQSDGSLVVGGLFTLIGGDGVLFNLARLTPNGSVDPKFNPVLGNAEVISDVAVQTDGRVIATGSFLNPNNHVRRFNADGSLDSSFSANVTGASTSKLLLASDGRVLVTVGNRTELARLTKSGERDPGFLVKANDAIRALAKDTKGRTLIAGYFTQVTASIDDVAHRYARRFLVRLGSATSGGGTSSQPKLGQVTFTPGGPIQFSIQTQTGVTYVLETKSTLNDPAWATAQTITGDGGAKTLQAVISGLSGFYRVRINP